MTTGPLQARLPGAHLTKLSRSQKVWSDMDTGRRVTTRHAGSRKRSSNRPFTCTSQPKHQVCGPSHPPTYMHPHVLCLSSTHQVHQALSYMELCFSGSGTWKQGPGNPH